jgi:hypothetical protein
MVFVRSFLRGSCSGCFLGSFLRGSYSGCFFHSFVIRRCNRRRIGWVFVYVCIVIQIVGHLSRSWLNFGQLKS